MRRLLTPVLLTMAIAALRSHCANVPPSPTTAVDGGQLGGVFMSAESLRKHMDNEHGGDGNRADDEAESDGVEEEADAPQSEHSAHEEDGAHTFPLFSPPAQSYRAVQPMVRTAAAAEVPRAAALPQAGHSHRVEWKFALAAREIMCFSDEYHHEYSNYTFAYDVAHGAARLHVWIQGPQEKIIYNSGTKEALSGDKFTFITEPTTFMFCFMNVNYVNVVKEIIYMIIEPTNQEANRVNAAGAPASLSSVLADNVHRRLGNVRRLQSAYRLQAEAGRAFAVHINAELNVINCVTAALMLCIGLGQTLVLRRIFTPRYSREKGALL